MVKNFADEKRAEAIRRFLKIFLFMYIFFPFRIKVLEKFQAYLFYACILLLIGLFFSELCYNNMKIKKWYPMFYFMAIFVFLMTMTIFLPIIKDTGDFTYLERYTSLLKRIIAIFGIAYLCEGLNDFIMLFISATTFYIIVTIFMLIPPIHLLYSNLVLVDPTSPDYGYMQLARFYTRIGLQGFSGYIWAFRCTFSVGMCCCEYIMKKLGYSTVKLLFYAMINLLGTIFYGRTGTIISIICIIITACYQLVIQRKSHLILLLGNCSLIMIWVFWQSFEYIQKNVSLSWAFEGVLSLVQSGKFETASSSYIMDKMFVRMPLDTFFFGDARYTTPSGLYYMGTDLGIMRPLLFWGLGGQIVYYAMPLLLLFPIKKYLKCKHSIFFLGIIVLIFVGFELKGEINFEICATLLGMYFALIRGTFTKKLRLKLKKSYCYVQDQETNMLR